MIINASYAQCYAGIMYAFVLTNTLSIHNIHPHTHNMILMTVTWIYTNILILAIIASWCTILFVSRLPYPLNTLAVL